MATSQRTVSELLACQVAQREWEVAMTDKSVGVHPMEDPQAQLERAFIDEYIRLHGYDPERVRSWPEAEVMTLLAAASIFAAGKLAEFDSRAHYVDDIHSKD
jgi:hypothetical protein